MNLSSEALQAVARQYWRDDTAYEGSPEHQRLLALWERELVDLHPWWALLDELKEELPGFIISNATATPDACLRCAVHPPANASRGAHRFITVGCVSIIAPVYIVYVLEYVSEGRERLQRRTLLDAFPDEVRYPTDIISRKIEQHYKATRLPREVATVPVALNIEPVSPSATTLFHALFTSEPESLP